MATGADGGPDWACLTGSRYSAHAVVLRAGGSFVGETGVLDIGSPSDRMRHCFEGTRFDASMVAT
jgi:hypothetical protein